MLLRRARHLSIHWDIQYINQVFVHIGGVGSLAGAGQLTELDLSNNRLTGALPALPAAIQMANMSGNAFAGGIPTSYGVLLTQSSGGNTCLRLAEQLPHRHECGWAAAAAVASTPWHRCLHAWLLAVQPCTALLHL